VSPSKGSGAYQLAGAQCTHQLLVIRRVGTNHGRTVCLIGVANDGCCCVFYHLLCLGRHLWASNRAKRTKATTTRVASQYKLNDSMCPAKDQSLIGLNFDERKVILGTNKYEAAYDFAQIVAAGRVAELGRFPSRWSWMTAQTLSTRSPSFGARVRTVRIQKGLLQSRRADPWAGSCCDAPSTNVDA
jgi:hypothetical protein